MPALMRRIRDLRGWRRAALALAAGGVMALAQPPLSLAVFLFFGLPVLLWLTDGCEGWRDGALIGWLAGLGYFGAGMFWIVEPFLVDPDRHGWMAPFALAGLAGGLALFWALAVSVAAFLWNRQRMLRIVLLAATLTLAEFARSHVLTGFPWALVGYSWLDTPVMQVAALTGPHGLGFLTLLAGLSLGLAGWQRIALPVLLVSAGWGFGTWQLSQPLAPPETPVQVRIVQPNAAQHLKWRDGYWQEFYNRLQSETAASAEIAPDIVIWPESAVPFLLGKDPAQARRMASALSENSRLILGIRRLGGDTGSDWHNALAVLGPDGSIEAAYDKYRLVPFGEFIPLGHLLARLGPDRIGTLTMTGYSSGLGAKTVELQGIPAFLPLICYEAIFPHGLHLDAQNRPGWLVQITNDAWFGEAAGPYQHLAQSRIRAIEQGLPLARSANTGVSAMIDARGRIVAQIGLGEQGRIDVQLPGPAPATTYAATGDWPALIVVGAAFLLTLLKFSGRFYRHKKAMNMSGRGGKS